MRIFLLWSVLVASLTAIYAPILFPELAKPGAFSMGEEPKPVSLYITFNTALNAKSFNEAKATFDKKMEAFHGHAQQHDIRKLEQVYLNQSFSRSPGGEYHVSGNALYQVDSMENAELLSDYLTGQNFQVTMETGYGGCGYYHVEM